MATSDHAGQSSQISHIKSAHITAPPRGKVRSDHVKSNQIRLGLFVPELTRKTPAFAFFLNRPSRTRTAQSQLTVGRPKQLTSPNFTRRHGKRPCRRPGPYLGRIKPNQHVVKLGVFVLELTHNTPASATLAGCPCTRTRSVKLADLYAENQRSGFRRPRGASRISRTSGRIGTYQSS
eukprot:COSAG06_NODE_7076_length_2644_cov_1.548527_3_plen_178_part_00